MPFHRVHFLLGEMGCKRGKGERTTSLVLLVHCGFQGQNPGHQDLLSHLVDPASHFNTCATQLWHFAINPPGAQTSSKSKFYSKCVESHWVTTNRAVQMLFWGWGHSPVVEFAYHGQSLGLISSISNKIRYKMQ